jgi:LacI family transcriptional regulator
MQIRMKDVAKKLGVSVATVSKVVRGHPDISPETKERVLGVIKELNYRPNLAARSLRAGRTQMIGLIVPDILHSFFAEIAKGVGNRIHPQGYNVVLFSSEENPELEIEGIESLLARQVDGLIVATTLTEAQADVFRRIDEQNTPYILVDRKIPGLQANYVGVDDEAVGALATEHLVQRGNRRIAHIRGPEISTANGRLKGYLSTLARFGLTVPADYIVKVGSSDVIAVEDGFQAMRQLLALRERPDAVFCFNDLAALGASRAILKAGLRVPADIALIGVANLPYSDMLGVPLSTIDQSSVEIGDRAAKLLLKRMKSAPGSRPARIIIPPKLIVRDSSAIHPGAKGEMKGAVASPELMTVGR